MHQMEILPIMVFSLPSDSLRVEANSNETMTKEGGSLGLGFLTDPWVVFLALQVSDTLGHAVPMC